MVCFSIILGLVTDARGLNSQLPRLVIAPMMLLNFFVPKFVKRRSGVFSLHCVHFKIGNAAANIERVGRSLLLWQMTLRNDPSVYSLVSRRFDR